ncbi:NACHT domain-containing protein [Rickettsia gravesii]|uniref:hypothetical protein n=1 Tax=Rickettsia gravesii TaxID=354585 RepID=UPI00036CFEAC|nr:hypothetical protein [Rickettsia gravesii]
MRKKLNFKDTLPIVTAKNMQTSILNPLITRLKTLYSSHDTLPKLIEDEKIKAQSLEEYYVKLQILLSEDDEAVKAALRDKVVGEKKLVEIENIFKAIDTEEKIRELFDKNYQVQEEKIDNIVKSLNEENKFAILRRNLTNKSTSEIKNIVEKINRMQVDIGKVLLLGSAGIGKTRGKEKLWNDKFDYVFRIRLKELLSNWTVRYGTNIDNDILICFVHYCLDSKDIKLEDIKSIQDKDRILLLLDGYD